MNPSRLFASVVLLLLVLFVVGCAGPSPERKHLETEWQLRHNMPAWSPITWNAWEAELAAALDKPEPFPPMFPDRDGDGEPDPWPLRPEEAPADDPGAADPADDSAAGVVADE